MGEMADYYLEDLIDDQRLVWVTRDGRMLKIAEMENSHLENTIKYLESRGYASALALKNGARDPVTVAETKMAITFKITLLRYESMLREREKRRGGPVPIK